jgi:hypothetical protein
MFPARRIAAPAAIAVALAGVGCGSASKPGPTSSAPVAGALSPEATSAATGDIPDSQVFLTFSDASAGYSIKYPEGWTQRGAGRDVTFADKNNLVHIVIESGPAPSTASVAGRLAALKASNPTLTFTTPRTVQLGGRSLIKATYTTESVPNPVTGKRVLLIVDRYAVPGVRGRYAVVDLGTAKGVDNVDAYRMMIESFHWL